VQVLFDFADRAAGTDPAGHDGYLVPGNLCIHDALARVSSILLRPSHVLSRRRPARGTVPASFVRIMRVNSFVPTIAGCQQFLRLVGFMLRRIGFELVVCARLVRNGMCVVGS
jgi:hypothetical protein